MHDRAKVTRMYGRDKNATCVIIWSLGNESGCGYNLVKARDALKSLDSGRASFLLALF
jgi:beta-galactosidase/beta-glucuronidase